MAAGWVAVNVMLIGPDWNCMFLLFSVDLSGFALITASVAAVPSSSGTHVLGELPCRLRLFIFQDFNLIAVRREGDFLDPLLASRRNAYMYKDRRNVITPVNGHAPTQATRTRRCKIYSGSRPPAGFNSPPESSLHVIAC